MLRMVVSTLFIDGWSFAFPHMQNQKRSFVLIGDGPPCQVELDHSLLSLAQLQARSMSHHLVKNVDLTPIIQKSAIHPELTIAT